MCTPLIENENKHIVLVKYIRFFFHPVRFHVVCSTPVNGKYGQSVYDGVSII